MSCEEGIECMFECSVNMDIKMCLEKCISQVDPEEQDVAWMLAECVMSYCMSDPMGYIDPDCYYWAIEGPCAEQYQMCIGGSQDCGPAGPGSCMGQCGGSSGNCYCDDACQDYGDCCDDYEACCLGPCVPNCQGKECGPDGCGGSCGQCPPGLPCNDQGQCEDEPNQKSCGDAVECALSCGGLDPNCLLNCMSGASGESQQLMFDLITCLVQVCGFNLDPTCIAGALSGQCSQEFAACMAD